MAFSAFLLGDNINKCASLKNTPDRIFCPWKLVYWKHCFQTAMIFLFQQSIVYGQVIINHTSVSLYPSTQVLTDDTLNPLGCPVL